MEFHEWEKYYKKIREEFGYSREKDEKAAQLLSSAIKRDAVLLLYGLIANRDVYVVGPAIISLPLLNGTIIAADDAVTVLLRKGVVPHIITTDLDGRISDLVYASSMGAVLVVHAHGDNVERIKKFIGAFPGPLVGSTQSSPLENVHNFGGFTDGDRAVFLAHHFGAKQITILGFDFDNVVLKGKSDFQTKLKKLQWAKALIMELIMQGAPITFA